MAEEKPVGKLLGPLYAPPARPAAFATKPEESRGRFYPEMESATRTCYQRDRDRIIHSTAFRRLKHKTQVFIQGQGDYYRTRMTHSLEVAQISRTIARILALNEDLAETVALAHDLGHTPFGHTGEDALDACTRHIGGFDHNAHALRLVAKLEHRYADFDGLNLTWESLEGLVKHNGPVTGSNIPAPIANFNAKWSLELASQPNLEAQIAALCDDIAYLNHDIDDGLRAGLFDVEDLSGAPFAGEILRQVGAQYGRIGMSRFVGELTRRSMGAMIDDLVGETRRRLEAARPNSAAAVRGHDGPLAAFTPSMAKKAQALKQFLLYRLYRNAKVVAKRERLKQVVTALFEAYAGNPTLMPAEWAQSCGAPGDDVSCGIVRDYIAGMTDSFALAEFKRIFHNEILP